jgi:putative hydrolase of the HAD superfamily
MMKSVIFDLDGTLLDRLWRKRSYRDASVEKFVSVQHDRLTEYLNHIPKSEYIFGTVQ